jgi:hypothetical protein
MVVGRTAILIHNPCNRNEQRSRYVHIEPKEELLVEPDHEIWIKEEDPEPDPVPPPPPRLPESPSKR